MGIIIRQSIKGTIVSYIGIVIGMINMLFLSTHFLSPSQIGITRVLLENALLFAFFAQFGAPHIATRFFPHFKNEKTKHGGFLFFLLAYSLIGFLFFIVVYLLLNPAFTYYYHEKSPELIPYYYYVVPLVFFTLYFNVFEAYSQVHGRIVAPTMIKELFLKLSYFVLVLLIAGHFINFNGFIYGTMIYYAMSTLLLVLYLKYEGWLHLRKDFSWITKSSMKEIVSYGSFIVLGGMGYILSTRIDVLMIASLSGLESTAVFSIAVFIAVVIEIPKRTISQITSPILAHAFKDKDLKKVGEIYSKTSINQLIAGSYVFLLIWCNIDAIFSLVPNAGIYSKGKYVVLFIGLARLIDMASGANNEIILNSKYYRFGLISMILLAFLTIITNLAFIPLYGINGAAFATALSIFIFTLVRLFFVKIKFGMQPYSAKTLIVLMIAIISFFAGMILPDLTHTVTGTISEIIYKCVIISLVFGILIYKFKASDDMNNLLVTAKSRFKNYTR